MTDTIKTSEFKATVKGTVVTIQKSTRVAKATFKRDANAALAFMNLDLCLTYAQAEESLKSSWASDQKS